ncbi:hypothetical protein [Neobacillus sp. PS3-40]|uniref:hypothetical protein n=1 Tax=Neobacillus sp. PS3-40 TaxID=3070679 RepID=UPI0027DF0C81|nr:hypothetical protein [Neobacillus sp. PS3-40]WML44223.1 hypothetical protein RCG20_21015 [Neobacillus sp. PS3-40]
MRWGPVISSSLIILFIVLYQWPKIKKEQKKEKGAFIILTAFGWLLATLLFLFPDLPGPTELIDFIFKPLGRLLE